jgi:sugar phosphate isomerase/epimerase
MNTPWPIGLSTGCFYRQGICSVLHDIESSGFRDLEICSFPRHLDYHSEVDLLKARDLLRLMELRPVSFHAPFAEHIDITSFDAAVRNAAVEELITACRAAALLGAERVVLHPGPERTGRPPEHEFIRHMQHAADSLNRVAACCCEEGVQLLLENMLPHLLFGQTSDMLYLLGAINTCTVSACLDTGHALLSGDLGNVIHKLSGHLKMVHINDNHGDWDAHLIPGEGSIDWVWLLSELRNGNFQGPLIIEMAGGEHEPVPDILARAKRGRANLEEFLPKS